MISQDATAAPDLSSIPNATVQSDFVKESAVKPLRVTCYGSSSSDTPQAYLDQAKSLGYILAKRGHTCVNGAGSFGCMAAMNDGALIGDGKIVGVIHEMWLAPSDTLRDGGAHTVFQSTENASSASGKVSKTQKIPGAKREMIVAGGKDLQERKRLLVDKADALVVLPGGPGTWDELWEMACARGIGLSSLPIVCVNCDKYYEPFHDMLKRAYKDGLTKLQPHELVHFEPTAEAAVRWVEHVAREGSATISPTGDDSTASALAKLPSFLHSPVLARSLSTVSDWTQSRPSWVNTTLIFSTGLMLGTALASAGCPRDRK